MKIGLEAAAVLALCTSACSRPFDGQVVSYRLESDRGAAASPDAAAKVVKARLVAAGLEGVGVGHDTSDGLFKIYVPRALVPRVYSIRRLAERPGTLELRLCASATNEKQRRERIATGVADVELPSELSWAPDAHGGPDMLVQTPERPSLIELKKLSEKGVAKDSMEYSAAVERHEAVVRDAVFTGDQFARAEVQRQFDRFVVFFEFKPERKSYFAAFTETHTNELLALIVDGKVDSAPRIMSKLPGAGIIEGGDGPFGFTEQEADEFVAVISNGPLPGRLVHVSTQDSE